MSPRATCGMVPKPMSNRTTGKTRSLDLKRKCPARVRNGRAEPDCTSPAAAGSSVLLDGDDAAEVVPLEEDIDILEAAATEETKVLVELIRDEDVFERLAFLRDL